MLAMLLLISIHRLLIALVFYTMLLIFMEDESFIINKNIDAIHIEKFLQAYSFSLKSNSILK